MTGLQDSLTNSRSMLRNCFDKMGQLFCLNDCFHQRDSTAGLPEALGETLYQYKAVKERFPDFVDGVVTSRPPSKVQLLADRYTLSKCIADLPTRELKRYAFSIFQKYPIEEHYSMDQDALLADDCTTSIGGKSHSAVYLQLVAKNGGTMFTIATHSDLRVNELVLQCQNTIAVRVRNLYGAPPNTDYIVQEINESLSRSLSKFNAFRALFPSCLYSPRFKRSFESATEPSQGAIFQAAEQAVRRKALTPMAPDGNLVKDVTPPKSRYRICELRIFNPIAYRVYFSEEEGRLFFALLEKKPPPQKQDQQIKRAAEIVAELHLPG